MFRYGGMAAGYSGLCERNKNAHCLLGKAGGDARAWPFTASSGRWAYQLPSWYMSILRSQVRVPHPDVYTHS